MKLDYNLINSVNKNNSDSHNKPTVTVIEDCPENTNWYAATKDNPQVINLQFLDYENKKEEIKRGIIYYNSSDLQTKNFDVQFWGFANVILRISSCDNGYVYDFRKKIYPRAKDIDFAEDIENYQTNIASSLGWYPWVIFYALQPCSSMAITFYNNDGGVSCNVIEMPFEAMKAYCFKYDLKTEKFVLDEVIPIKTVEGD